MLVRGIPAVIGAFVNRSRSSLVLITAGVRFKKMETSMRTMSLILAAAFVLSIPAATVVKAEETTIIKKHRDFDRDRGDVVIKKSEPRHMYMEERDRDDVHVRGHGPGVGVGVDVGR
jgi:hypothetical protein